MGMANSKSRQKRPPSWSDLTHDVLLLIIMKVGVVDFLSFSRVCKSWRLLALSNKNKFLASRPPMSIRIRRHDFRKDCCYLEDSDGRKFKTTLRHSAERKLIGLTCGYLILYGNETRDFWLVNPITRHELHFHGFRFCFDGTPEKVRATVVYSPSLSGWVFIMGHRLCNLICFSVAGTGDWTSDYNCGHHTLDLHVFKGEIYSINSFCEVYELRLNRYPRLTLLKTNNVPNVRDFGWEIVSLRENLYVIRSNMLNEYNLLELDTCAQPNNTIGYDSYANRLQSYGIDTIFHANCRKDKFFKMRYHTHDCMSVPITD